MQASVMAVVEINQVVKEKQIVPRKATAHLSTHQVRSLPVVIVFRPIIKIAHDLFPN